LLDCVLTQVDFAVLDQVRRIIVHGNLNLAIIPLVRQAIDKLDGESPVNTDRQGIKRNTTGLHNTCGKSPGQMPAFAPRGYGQHGIKAVQCDQIEAAGNTSAGFGIGLDPTRYACPDLIDP
jgi:hypothetical protein